MLAARLAQCIQGELQRDRSCGSSCADAHIGAAAPSPGAAIGGSSERVEQNDCPTAGLGSVIGSDYKKLLRLRIVSDAGAEFFFLWQVHGAAWHHRRHQLCKQFRTSSLFATVFMLFVVLLCCLMS